MKNIINENKGITLVALVITIIVLIILAGISISILLGEGGLISKSQRGAENYKAAAANEQSMLESINEYLEGTIDDINSNSPANNTPVQATERLLTQEFESNDNSICTISASSVWNNKQPYMAFSKVGGLNVWLANGYAPQWLSVEFKSGKYKITKISLVSYYNNNLGSWYDSTDFELQGRNSDSEEYTTIYTYEGDSSETAVTHNINATEYYNDIRIKVLGGSGYSGIGSLEIYGIPQ